MDTALWCGPITHAPSVTVASRNVEVTDDRAIVRWVYMYLREGTVPLEDVDESRAELAEEDVVEEAAEEAAVVLERLERDPLRDVVRRVRHPSLRVLLFLDSSSTMSVVVDRRERAGGKRWEWDDEAVNRGGGGQRRGGKNGVRGRNGGRVF
jgi:hypothetical protein